MLLECYHREHTVEEPDIDTRVTKFVCQRSPRAEVLAAYILQIAADPSRSHSTLTLEHDTCDRERLTYIIGISSKVLSARWSASNQGLFWDSLDAALPFVWDMGVNDCQRTTQDANERDGSFMTHL